MFNSNNNYDYHNDFLFHRKLRTPVGEASAVQAKALAIVPKVTSSLSIIASSYIVYDILIKTPRKNRKLYHEIMLGMHISDLICSIAWFFTTWPIPPDVFPAWGASGTQATCSAQGFFTQFSVCTVCYSGFLALYYLLVIKYGWTEIRLHNYKIKYIIHTISIIMGLGTASVSLGLGLMNPIGWDCWIASVPLGCKESWQNNGESSDCIRGDNANLYQWLFFYLPLWITIVFVTVAMVIVYTAYTKQVQKASRWSKRRSFLSSSSSSGKNSSNNFTTSPSMIRSFLLKKSSSGMNNNNNSSTRSTKMNRSQATTGTNGSTKLESQKSLMQTQMILYVGSFYIVWLFPTILRITELTGDTVWYHWVLLSAMFVPSQGFLNVFVFLRPRWIQHRQQRKEKEELEKRLNKHQMFDKEEGNNKSANNNKGGGVGGTVKTCVTSIEPPSTSSSFIMDPPSEGLEKSEPINLIMEDDEEENGNGGDINSNNNNSIITDTERTTTCHNDEDDDLPEEGGGGVEESDNTADAGSSDRDRDRQQRESSHHSQQADDDDAAAAITPTSSVAVWVKNTDDDVAIQQSH